MSTKDTKSVTEQVRELVLPIAEKLSLSLWDVEFGKEGAMWILRLLIDKEGGVSTDDCEALSRAVDGPLDELDPIDQSYYLEVSSAGLDRKLYRPADFARFMNSEVEIKLYQPIEKRKQFIGFLRGYDEKGTVTIEEDGKMLSFEAEKVAVVRLYPRF